MSLGVRRFLRVRSQSRYGMWVNNSGGPTDEEIMLVASRRISFAIFNADRAEFAAKLKQCDPGVKIYAYVCLSSVRSFEPTLPIAGAVAYNDAQTHGWLAKDTTGNNILWGPYGGHYQGAVWNSAYQDAYIAHIETVLRDPLWDGIWADNDFWTLRYYSDALLEGTSTQDETDKKIRDGLDVLVQRAGACARSYGKILMPNYGDGRLSPSRQVQHAVWGGGSTEEMFGAWTGATAPTVYLWGDGDWTYQIGNIRDGHVDGALTQVKTLADTRTALYGYCSFLLRARPGDGWAAMPSDMVQGSMPWMEFQDIPVGYPTGPYIVQSSGVYARLFEHAFVAVNPTEGELSVTLPDGAVQSMAALTGLLAPLSSL